MGVGAIAHQHRLLAALRWGLSWCVLSRRSANAGWLKNCRLSGVSQGKIPALASFHPHTFLPGSRVGIRLLSAHRGDEAARVIAAATTIAASASQRRELDDVPKSATLAELPAVYFEMGKGKLSALVTMTAAAGYLMAVPVGTPIALDMLLMTSTGTMLAAMSASAFNQVVERENDSRMTRTMRRPLVTRKISPGHAYGVASLAGIGGVALLALQVNPVTAALGAANIALYTCVYTPMKQKTHWNTWMGAVVGAIPPMMGWAAVTGNIGVGAMVMGGILFSWQMPHFLSLAYMMRKDYVSGGYVMMPGEAGSPELARATVATMRHCIYLEMLCVAMPILGMADPIFVAEATVLNGGFLYLAYQFHTHGASSNQGKTNASARKLFLASLLYLPLLLACMILHRTTDGENRHCIGAHPGAIPGEACPYLDANKIASNPQQPLSSKEAS